MAQDTRVCEEGLLAPKGVKIGTAHADLPHADECLIWSRRLWFLHLEEAQLLRLVQNDCFHTIVTFILQRVQSTVAVTSTTPARPRYVVPPAADRYAHSHLRVRSRASGGRGRDRRAAACSPRRALSYSTPMSPGIDRHEELAAWSAWDDTLRCAQSCGLPGCCHRAVCGGWTLPSRVQTALATDA